MNPNLDEQLARLPAALGDHIVLSGIALGIGTALSLPLALVVARSRPLRWPVLATVSIVQTVPSLALLALMVPLLGAFGFWPALAALVLYSMLPIVSNTVAGINNVEPELLEAARGLGMTRRQVLWLVELPLALPVIVAGLRTAAVWVVGIATLSTPVGQRSLGDFIFAGLQTRNWTAVLVGSSAAAALAVTLDTLLSLLERALRRRSRPGFVGALLGLAVVFGGGALAAGPWGSLGASAAHIEAARGEPMPTASARAPERAARVRIGSKTFSEQYILAALIERRLTAASIPSERSEGLGSTIAFDALRQSAIDVYVDYSGTLWANAMKRTDVPQPWQMLAELSAWLADEHGIRLLGSLGFENAYALAMRRDRAVADGIQTISDLAPRAPSLRIGSDYEFFDRPEWPRLRDAYGLAFRERTKYDASFLYRALADHEVDLITAFSSDGRIAADDLLVLADPLHAILPYEAVLLLSPRVAADARVVAALSPLLGSISTERMRSANFMVDREREKRTPAEAARWLDEQRTGSPAAR